MKHSGAGTLTIAAVPIGCLDDASPRLVAALAGARIIAAEDTRRVRRLAAGLGVTLSATLVSYYDPVEQRRATELAGALAAGQDVLLVTDAGTPGLSDPGYRLVTAARAAGARVTALPGPSAITTALAASGLPSDRFCFEGFLPRRAGDRSRRLAGLAAEPRTLVFFESPRRLAATLAELAGAFGGQRQATVCRELTKTHEEIRGGTLDELAGWAAAGVRGEITLVVAGAGATAAGAAAAAGAGARATGTGRTGTGRTGTGRTGAAGAAAATAPGVRYRSVPMTAGQAGDMEGDPGDNAGLNAAVDEVAARVAAGASRKDAIAGVAAARGLRRRELYEAVIHRVQA